MQVASKASQITSLESEITLHSPELKALENGVINRHDKKSIWICESCFQSIPQRLVRSRKQSLTSRGRVKSKNDTFLVRGLSCCSDGCSPYSQAFTIN